MVLIFWIELVFSEAKLEREKMIVKGSKNSFINIFFLSNYIKKGKVVLLKGCFIKKAFYKKGVLSIGVLSKGKFTKIGHFSIRVF